MSEVISPNVNEDCSVTFKFKSEYAKRVEIAGEFKLGRKVVGPGAPVESVPMKKTSDSIWTITTEPMLPGIYRYTFIVDGVKTLDPLNPRRRYHGAAPMSMLKVEGDEPMPWDLIPEIPHGTVIIEKFYSGITKQVKCCTVYLPPSYRSTRKGYPVLYLLHGGGDDYGSWFFDGNADHIMDSLISKGASKEMVVVMPDGWTAYPEEMSRFRGPESERTPTVRAAIRSMISSRHVDYFVNELVPFIESRYRVLRGSRAIAGLSMGGAQTMNLMTSHPDMFVAAGMFSSGPADEARDRLPLVEEQIKRSKLIYISCGSWDSILEVTRSLRSLLVESGTHHIYVEGDGGHIWSFWQRSLVDFVSRFSLTLKL